MTIRAPAVATLSALLLAVAGCGLGGDDEVAGGAGDLPGTVPAGVTFAPPPENALNAPDFTAELVDGTEITASELWRDRPVVLLFTASWCERCAVLHREVAGVVDDHPGVALLGVASTEDAAAAARYADELDLPYPLAVADEQVWLSYAAREPPVVVLVAPGGKVLRGWPGGVDRGVLDAELDDAVRRR